MSGNFIDMLVLLFVGFFTFQRLPKALNFSVECSKVFSGLEWNSYRCSCFLRFMVAHASHLNLVFRTRDKEEERKRGREGEREKEKEKPRDHGHKETEKSRETTRERKSSRERERSRDRERYCVLLFGL